MWQPVVRSGKVLTLLGGGPAHLSHLKQSLKLAPLLVAADGGSDSALRAGLQPAAVIGDMDSISDGARAQIAPEALHHIPEQDSTDFEKCLTRIEAPGILAHGFLAGRLDHELAVLNTLARYPDMRCILIGSQDLCFLAPAQLRIDLTAGTRVSLFPLARVRADADGLHYPVRNLELSPMGQIGTSNSATGPVDLSVDQRGLFVILPRSCLRASIEALGLMDAIEDG
ncbi:MAG: thiamine diphosphokinase [Pseudomonadota bacterium]